MRGALLVLYRQSGPDAEGLASIDAGKCHGLTACQCIYIYILYGVIYIYMIIYAYSTVT